MNKRADVFSKEQVIDKYCALRTVVSEILRAQEPDDPMYADCMCPHYPNAKTGDGRVRDWVWDTILDAVARELKLPSHHLETLIKSAIFEAKGGEKIEDTL